MGSQFPWRAVGVLLIAIALGVAGQFSLKVGLNRLGHPTPIEVFKAILTPYILGGFAMYALSSLFYLQALAKLPLSYAYPMIALSYVAVVLGAWLFFGERINSIRVCSIVVIIAGVALLALSYVGATPQAH